MKSGSPVREVLKWRRNLFILLAIIASSQRPSKSIDASSGTCEKEKKKTLLGNSRQLHVVPLMAV